MTTENNADRRKKIIIFSLILLTTVGIASFLISMLWSKEEYMPVAKTAEAKQSLISPASYSTLLEGNEVLRNHLNALLQLDQQYTDALTKSNNKKELDAIGSLITTREETFRASIDSFISQTPDQEDSTFNKLFNNIVSSYQSMLQGRHTTTSLRNAIAINKNGLSTDQTAILKTQNELQDKERRISSLEAELKTINATKGNVIKQPAGANENITALKENITSQESRIASLISVNNNLKKDIDRLTREQNESSKNTSSDAVTLKNKAAGLQQRIDELSAELQLSQVDCNLSRVDAAKIISNSRQRKELLAEASGILTSLSKSDDPEIKKKVQYKIVRLNQIAANSRD